MSAQNISQKGSDITVEREINDVPVLSQVFSEEVLGIISMKGIYPQGTA